MKRKKHGAILKEEEEEGPVDETKASQTHFLFKREIAPSLPPPPPPPPPQDEVNNRH